jgi:TolA protein
VMWARTVRSPAATPEWKLPGPVVEAPVPVPEKKVAPPLIELGKKGAKEKKEEETRQKAMQEALASISKDLESRPTPRPDNFPSLAPGPDKGPPAGPFGGGAGTGPADPVRDAYALQIRQAINENLIWVQQRDRWQARASFRIDSQGNILDPSLTQTSGNELFDRAVLRAIRKSSPLPAPPPPVAREAFQEGVELSFDIPRG